MSKRARFRQAERALKTIGKRIGDGLPEGMGYALVVFPFHEPGWGQYVSNAEREDMIKALREAAIHLEARTDHPPGVDPRVFDGN